MQETNQKLRNETGIMRKKFSSLQKEIDDQKEEIRKYQAEISKLNGVIRNLQKDIVGLKKEMQERDETIQDKVYSVLQCFMQYFLVRGACQFMGFQTPQAPTAGSQGSIWVFIPFTVSVSKSLLG